jgi:hypothetical protein
MSKTAAQGNVKMIHSPISPERGRLALANCGATLETASGPRARLESRPRSQVNTSPA